MEICALKEYHSRTRALLRKHEHLCYGHLEHIHATTHHIDLIPGVRPLTSAPYRPGPKSGEADDFKINCQLNAGVIERSNAGWAAPVLFTPRMAGRLRL